MAVPEKIVEEVVGDVSKRMKDPNYGQLAVGTFVQSQPDISRFVSANTEELGGGEAVIHAVFHAEVLAECYRRHRGRPLPVVDFVDLDESATSDMPKDFAKAEPALASYVASNVEEAPVQKLLAHLGLAFNRVS